MPSTHRVAAGLVVLVGVLALVYSMLIVQQVLLGVGVLLAALALAAIVYYGGTDRRTLVRATMAVTVVYGAVTFQLPLAVVAACVVYLTAWVTGPDSPVDAPDTTILPVLDTLGRDVADSPDTASATADGDDPRR
ncbi:putative membrane protein YccC [Halarchaeum rubridurum]|uniref:Putative membrane protein YccC n=1 Tax=Halarchaeum rubridurum TaxID=489911 RepID=A0A830FZG3_9EURY|nr:hypothetical protein [Halarchaeum rubridurum]MBP1953265.1 putative membrane protein YccC [Halarchaeum rubridurum]GGM66638.1 hypothetical protein GCM10009017_15890 [Halarchaeum rubridurum]